MGKWVFTQDELDRQFAEATQRGQEVSRSEPRAVSVSYDEQRNRLAIEMIDGTLLAIPVQHIQGLSGASPDDIRAVELAPIGDALRWENLDLDYGVAGLAAGRLGSRTWMAELGRRGGSAQTESKAAAARENGRKGGRPRKRTPLPISQSFRAVPLERRLEVLDSDLTEQSQMTTDKLVEYERMVVSGYVAFTRKFRVARRERIAATLENVQLPSLTASVELRGGRFGWLPEGSKDAELPLAA